MELKTIYYGLLALCLVTLLLRYRKLPKYILWFIPIISVAFASELMTHYFEEYKNLLHRIYQPIECLLLLCFYSELLNKPKNKRFIRLSYLVFLVSCVCFYLLYKRTFNITDYFDFITEAFLICILVALFFFELLDYKEEVNLMKYGAFWINAVHLIFYGGSFFAYAFWGQISQNPTPLGKQLQSIPFFLNLLLYTAYSIIFAFARK